MKLKPFFIVLLLVIVPLPLSIQAQVKQTNGLLATQEEVNQFLAAYVVRYNGRDIDGFLALFSLKAIQNKKDGLEAIRRIYTDFFNQSLELRYRVEGLKQEIYENAVEIRARYVINQVVKGSRKEKDWIGRIRWVLVKEDGALKILSLDHQHDKSL